MSLAGEKASLHGLKVLEMAQLIAGPMAGTFLADLGADVVHVEDPVHGDPQRKVGKSHEGSYLWWKVSGRNKRCVTLDLRQPEGQDLARKMATEWADVVITNFRVETLEKWQLDWSALHRANPKLIVLHVNGFGTNTSLRNSPGFGKVGEAMSGVVQITGFPDGPPVHTGFSHADSLTGLMGAFAIQVALYRREHDPEFQGEFIDLPLFETLYRLIEWQVVNYDVTGVVPVRAGNRLTNSPAAVINTYLSADDQWITVTSGTPRSVKNVAALLGEPAEEYDTVEKQTERQGRLDALLTAWVRARPAAEALEAMLSIEVVASRVFTMADIVDDPTYRERGDIIEVEDETFGTVKMQAVIPQMSNHPGRVWRTGPALGMDNELVYKQELGMSDEQFDEFHKRGVI
jgi:formyl-CoA transferase